VTCIVGIVTPERKVVLGGDSAGSNGFGIHTRRDPKVFKNGEFVIGYTTSFRMGQLLRFSFAQPDVKEGIDPYEYMVKAVVPAIMRVFLIGWRGGLYRIEEDFQVAVEGHDFAAVGSGMYVAEGALYATREHPGITPMERLRIALEAAVEFNAGVRGPFTYVETD
jgi:ATP-dependent protease HslVU (ClpYQ) peptidase subunit